MNLESLQSRRIWLVGGTVLALLIVAASYFLVILPKLSDASDTRAQSRDTDQSNTQLLARQAKLASQEKGIAGMRENLAAAVLGLPPTSALPEFTHEVTHAATTSRVTLQNISIGALAPVAAVATQAPAASATATTSTAPTATAAPASPTSATQYQLNITLTTTGPVGNQLAFIKAIQNGPRRALITSTTYSGHGSEFALITQLTIFTAPMSVQQLAQLRKLLLAS